MVTLMAWRLKVLKSGEMKITALQYICEKVLVTFDFTMAYIFTFGKLAYMILQSNVDTFQRKRKLSISISTLHHPPCQFSRVSQKEKIWFQVFMDLGVLSYNLWRVGILNHVWGSTLTVFNWISTSLMAVTTDLIVIFLRCMETSSFYFTCWNVRNQCK